MIAHAGGALAWAMRRRPSPWRAVAVFALALACPTPGAAQEPGPLASPSELAALEQAALGVAETGRVALALEVLDCCRALGLPGDAAAVLDRNLRAAAAKAQMAYGPLPKEARALVEAATPLATRLPKLPAVEAQALASVLLRLHGECEPARRLLGHARSPTGGWTAPADRDLAAGRVRMLEVAARARELPVTVEASESRHVMLAAADPASRVCVRYGAVVLHTDFDRATACRIVREGVRALAVSDALRTGTWRVPEPPTLAREMVMLTTKPTWDAAVAAARAAGTVYDPAFDPAQDRRFFDTRGFIVYFQWDPAYGSSLILWGLSSRLWRETPAAFALAGHVDWVTTTYLRSVPGIWRGRRSVADPTGTGLSEAFARHRAALRRCAGTGLAGQAAWLAHLVRHGEDPGIERFTVTDLGLLLGDVRTKLDACVAWLHERGPIEPHLASLGGSEGPSPEQFAAAAGGTLPEVERRFRDWLLDGRSGVADLLDPPAPRRAPDRAAALVALVVAARTRACAPDVPKEILQVPEWDADLSDGCRLHAEYLQRTPKATGAEALVEHPDGPATAAGAWAAHHALVCRGAGKPEAAVETCLATLEGRAALLEPGLSRLGVAEAGSVLVVDARSLVADVDEHWFLTWPPVGARDVPRAYADAGLPPVPGERRRPMGYPISVHRSPFRGAAALTSMTLRTLAKGAVVPCHFVTANDPEWSSRLPPQVFALIPKEPLEPRTDYRAEIESPGGTTYGWEFRTGR